jgi:exopolysaccharide biosynthesis polyprenyl glycosylphosphotransferase
MVSRRQLMKHLAKVFDLCAVVIAVVAATIVVHHSFRDMTLAEFMAVRVKVGNCAVGGLLLFLWHNLFMFCGLYSSKRLTTRWIQGVELCKATLLAAAVLLIAAKVFHLLIVNGTFVMVFWLCSTFIMVAGRLLVQPLLLALRSRGRNSRFLIVIGTNRRAIEFARDITGRPELGYRIVGFVDDDWAGMAGFEATGYSRCSTFAGLHAFLRHTAVDEAAIYLPLRSYYEHAAQLASLCEQHGIAVRFDSQVVTPSAARSQAHDPTGPPQIPDPASSNDLLPALIKRGLDSVFSLVLLVLLTPVFLLVGALIKMTSSGPIFFRQTRIGLNKRQFRIVKFRTMIRQAEELQDQLLAMNEMRGPVFKIRDDPRVTPLGRILRKTSIDELPQLFNVLVGDMSLVGPRAMSLRDYQLFEQDSHRRRFSVKPGITCLWQINGRNSIPFEKWMELDMQYIDKWSLWLDFKILARTVPAVLRGTGAA